MTYLNRLPRGSQGRSRADVLRELIEQIDDETNPLSVAARQALEAAERDEAAS